MNGFHIHFTDAQIRTIVNRAVICIIALVIVVGALGLLGVFKCDDNPVPAFSQHSPSGELAPPNKGADSAESALNAVAKPTSLPDIQILLSGNKYGAQGLAEDIGGITDTLLDYNCPIAVFGGGFITDDSAHMVRFLEIKVMKIDAQGNELFFWEDYKPGGSENGSDYQFETECLAGQTCQEPFSNDTIFAGQEDVYVNFLRVNGVGNYAVQVEPNAQNLWKECPGCGNNFFYFGFHYDTLRSNGNLIWDGEKNDSLLTPAIKRALKNHK